MKKIRNLLSILLIFSLVLSLGVTSAFAADPDDDNPGVATPTTGSENRYEGDVGDLKDINGASMSFDKYLVLKKSAEVPTVKFKFVIEAGDDGGAADAGVFIMPVPYTDASTPYNVLGQPVFVAGTDVTLAKTAYANDSAILQYQPGDTTADEGTQATTETIDFMTATADDEKYAEKPLTVSFAGVTFLEPGVYRYTITESEDTTGGSALPGLQLDPAVAERGGTSTKRFLDVYVTDSPDGSDGHQLDISGYVLHEKSNAPTIDSSTRGTADVTTDGDRLLDKSTGFSNWWDTCDLEFKKEVTGNQASRDKYFKFTVKVSSTPALTDDLVFEVDMGHATAAPSKNVATTYTAAAMLAANTTELDAATVPGKLLVKGGDLDAGKVFYLQHGQYIRIKGLPAGATYTVTELAEDYQSTAAAVTDYKNVTNGVLSEEDAKNRNNNEAEARDDVVYTSFLNSRNGTIPTGIITVIGPAVAVILLGLGGLGFVLAGKRRREEGAE